MESSGENYNILKPENEGEVSCTKKIQDGGEKVRVFDTTYMLINSQLAAASVRAKYPASDCFEEL